MKDMRRVEVELVRWVRQSARTNLGHRRGEEQDVVAREDPAAEEGAREEPEASEHHDERRG